MSCRHDFLAWPSAASVDVNWNITWPDCHINGQLCFQGWNEGRCPSYQRVLVLLLSTIRGEALSTLGPRARCCCLAFSCSGRIFFFFSVKEAGEANTVDVTETDIYNRSSNQNSAQLIFTGKWISLSPQCSQLSNDCRARVVDALIQNT